MSTGSSAGVATPAANTLPPKNDPAITVAMAVKIGIQKSFR
jgi:hypothetical protein